MSDESFLQKYESLCGRKIDAEERQVILSFKEKLNVGDDDGIWGIFAVLSWYRTFSKDLPKEIEARTRALANEYTRFAQAGLDREKFFGAVLLGIIFSFGIASLSMLAGFFIASGKLSPCTILQVPVGPVAGCLILVGAVVAMFWAARDFAVPPSEGEKWWKRAWVFRSLVALGGIATGCALLGLSLR